MGKRFTRTDFTLQTKQGLNLQCSHWEPVERTAVRIPVVIYMHGNASARVEVLPQLTVLLALGVAVFAFDFAGSGKSDGEHVTLGYYEREDLMCVVAHLRATDVVSTIALWGRSMGAGEFGVWYVFQSLSPVLHLLYHANQSCEHLPSDDSDGINAWRSRSQYCRDGIRFTLF